MKHKSWKKKVNKLDQKPICNLKDIVKMQS